MEVKNWSYEEFPDFTEELEGVKRLDSSGDEVGTYCFPSVEYANVNGKTLHLYIMVPITRNLREKDIQYPCVVFVQGSAWMKQNIMEKIGMLAKLVERGYVVAITEYRDSSIAKFPAQAEDARNAIRFVKKNSKTYGIDADNIFVAGDSSGGHTAMFAGIIKDDEEQSNLYPGIAANIKGIISYYGSSSVMLEDGMPTTINHHMPDSPEGMEMGGVNLKVNRDLCRKLSVECNIHEDTALPPVLLFHGTKDRIINVRISVLVYQRLKELGKEADLYLINGGDHGGPEFWTDEVIEILDAFLKKCM